MVNKDELTQALGNQYTLENIIGQGSMSVVYEGVDKQTQKAVAIKVVESDGNQTETRFRNEITALSQLKHPNILPISDVVISDSVLCYVMPLIKGGSLEDLLLKHGRLPIRTAIMISLSIAEAIEYAHSKGLLHRDIKPANILIPEDAEEQNFKNLLVTDFGVVGLLQKDTQTTITGQMYGTPLYMSPEQLLGKPQYKKSDIYGLGIILYEMIYGNLPFSGDNALRIMQNIINSPVLCPDSPEIPKKVKRFIEQCLNKNIEKRPTQVVENLKLLLVTDDVAFSAEKSYRIPIILWFVRLFGILALLIFLYLSNIHQHFLNLLNVLSITNTEVLLGVLFIIVGIITGILVKKWIAWNSKKLQDNVNSISQGDVGTENLSMSMATDLKELLNQCKNADERILGKTVAIMIDEYKNAESFDNRKDALLAAVEFLDKLNARLSPWYIKYEKLIVIAVSLVGIASGIVKIINSVD